MMWPLETSAAAPTTKAPSLTNSSKVPMAGCGKSRDWRRTCRPDGVWPLKITEKTTLTAPSERQKRTGASGDAALNSEGAKNSSTDEFCANKAKMSPCWGGEVQIPTLAHACAVG